MQSSNFLAGRFNLLLPGLVLLMLSGLLMACGDNTATTNPPFVTTTSVANTATGVVATVTPLPATATLAQPTATSLATTVSVRSTATIPATTVTSKKPLELPLPQIAGVSELPLKEEFIQEIKEDLDDYCPTYLDCFSFKKEFNQEIKGNLDFSITAFGSSLTRAELAGSYHAALSRLGYKPQIALNSKKQEFVGVYDGKIGSLMVNIAPVLSSNKLGENGFNINGLSFSATKNLIGMAEAINQKSLAFVVAGTNPINFDSPTVKATPSPSQLTPAPKVTGNATASLDYPQAQPISLSETTQKAVSVLIGDPGVVKAKYQSFLTKDAPKTVADFYAQGWTAQGYSAGSNVSTKNIITEILRYEFHQDKQERVIFAIKFNEDFGVKDTIKSIPELAGKIKVGDTLVVIVSGESDF